MAKFFNSVTGQIEDDGKDLGDYSGGITTRKETFVPENLQNRRIMNNNYMESQQALQNSADISGVNSILDQNRNAILEKQAQEKQAFSDSMGAQAIGQEDLVGKIQKPMQGPMPSQMGFANPYAESYKTQLQGIGTGMAAAQMGAKAQADFAKQLQGINQSVDQQYQDQLAENQRKQQEQLSKVQQATNDIQEAAKINPNKFWQEKGTGEKITAALAIGLGAIGSAMTGGRNIALDQIDRAIDRDIAAQEKLYMNQKDSLAASQSLLGLYDKAVGDTAAAKMLAKRDAYSLAELKLNEQMAGVQGKKAQQEYLMLKGGLQEKQAGINAQIAQMMGQAAMKQKLYSGEGFDSPLDLPEKLQDNAVKVGNTWRLAANATGAKELQNRLPVMEDMMNKSNELQSLLNKNGYVASKWPGETAGKIKTLSTLLLADIKDDKKLGALDKGSVEVIRDIIGDGSAFWEGQQIARLKTLNDQIIKSRENLLNQNIIGYKRLK